MKKMRYLPTEQLGMLAVQQVFSQIGWIERPQYKCDMGIDLHVEECHKGDPTGRLLALQVKSGVSYWDKVNEDKVVLPISQTHHDYWINHSLPVLVALYHPDAKKIIWQHISPETCINTGEGWKTEIPRTHELTLDSVRELSLLAKVPSLQDAVKKDQERIAGLDARFHEPYITASPDGTQILHNAKENVQFTLQMTGPPERIAERYTNLVERGRAVTFEKGEIQLSGSPLFDRITDDVEGELTIQAALTRPVTLSLVAIAVSGNDLARIDSIPATLTAGTEFFTISGGLRNSPLSSITMETRNNFAEKCGMVQMKFDATVWFGRRLLQLSYFDQIHRLFKALQNGAKLGFECYVEGNRLFSSVANGYSKQRENWIRFVDVVGKARFIAKRLGLNPNLPELSMKQVDEVEVLCKLLQEGEVVTDASGLEITSKFRLTSDFLDHPAMKKGGDPFQVTLDDKEPQQMPFLGNDVEVGPLWKSANSVRLSNREAVEQKLKRGNDGEEVDLVFEGTDECKLIRKIRRNGGS